MPTDQEFYDQLAFYTLSHPDPAFLHQNIVDAYAVQHASEHSTPISVVYGLIGLYLHLEKGFTGKQVQRMHMVLARHRRQWPVLTPPESPASITVADVLDAPPGPQRDQAIRNWCAAVWETWQLHRTYIADIARKELDIQ